MDLEPADEILNLLLHDLTCRPGSVQERLRYAWTAHGPKLTAEQLPEANREDYAAVRDALAGPEPLDEAEAAEIACTVVWLRGEVALAYGRQQEREMQAGRWRRHG